jgi:hypothetical protein
LPNCWRPIFLVLPKLYRCQVGLPNCWSCSNRRECPPIIVGHSGSSLTVVAYDG